MIPDAVSNWNVNAEIMEKTVSRMMLEIHPTWSAAKGNPSNAAPTMELQRFTTHETIEAAPPKSEVSGVGVMGRLKVT